MSERNLPIERDEHGYFAKGNRGGPGRSTAAKETKYLRALGAVVTLEDWKEIALQAVEDAKQGDRHAREWLSKYLIGPPSTTIGAIKEEKEDPRTGEKIRRLAVVLQNLTSVVSDDWNDDDDDDSSWEDGDVIEMETS